MTKKQSEKKECVLVNIMYSGDYVNERHSSDENIGHEWIMELQRLFDKHKNDPKYKSVADSLEWQREQAKRRRNGEPFTIRDHIRGMVYAILSNQRDWSDVARNISPVDKLANIF